MTIAPRAEPARARNPWAVLLCTVGTLGVYAWFWWHAVNRELRDLGRDRGVDLGRSPGRSTLAYVLGAMVVVPQIITIVNTHSRVRHAQRAVGVEPPRPVVGILVWVLSLTLAGPAYLQRQLNQVWDAPSYDGDSVSRRAMLAELHAAGALSDDELVAQRMRLGL